MNRSRYQKIADAAYDRIADANEKFDIGDVINAVAGELSGETTNADLIREFAQTLAAVSDRKRTSRAESGQYDLLTGEVEAMDAVWRLGTGERVRARKARRRELLLWLGVRGENADRVASAFQRDRETVAELLLYMPDEATTVEQAVETRAKKREIKGVKPTQP